VGRGDVTPIRHDEAVKKYQGLLQGDRDNPFIMLNCPWCGIQMGPVEFGRSNHVKKATSRGQILNGLNFVVMMKTAIFITDCPFMWWMKRFIANARHSSSVRSTNLRSLPWYSDARNLFGLDTGGRSSPPDLIIQDELHLISGPLGSMVGHYETAIDALCTHTLNGVKFSAKIIASTATICRAGEQVHNLYDRDVFLFPPQGLKAGESFFAHEDRSVPGRLYVGVS
jgi:hypothetical protein